MTAPMAVPILNCRLKNAGTGDDLTRLHLQLVDKVTRNGQRWISETRVCGRSVLRVMVISYLTGAQELGDLQVALQSAAAELHGGALH